MPRDLETVCLKCLEKDPSRRYGTARSLSEDLRRFLDHEPVLARPISLRHRVRNWARRHPVHAAALLLAVCMGVGLVAGLVHRNDLVQRHAREREREVIRADASEKLAQRHLKAFQLRQARDALDANQVERTQDLLRDIEADAEAALTTPTRHGFAWNYLMAQARRDVVVLSDRHSERVSAIGVSPDGRTLVTGDEDGTIRLRDPDTGQIMKRLGEHQLPINRLSIAPSGSRLASVARTGKALRTEIFVWDLPTGHLAARLDEPSGRGVAEVKFDPTGNFLWDVEVGEGRQPRVRLWRLAATSEKGRLLWTRPIRSHSSPLSSDGRFVALEEKDARFVVRDVHGNDVGHTGAIDLGGKFAIPSPDGRLLAISGDSGTVILWDLAAGRERRRFEHDGEDPGRLFFSPDGRYLGCSYRNGALVVNDLISGARHVITSGISDPDLRSSTCFSPDNRLLARNIPNDSAGRAQPTQIWQLDPWRQIACYPGIPQPSEAHVFGRKGESHFASLGYEAIRWDYTSPRDPEQPVGHDDEAWSLAFSPDSAMLASGSDDTDEPRTIKLWDVASGRQIRGWNAGVGTVSALAFDPSGRVLASGHLGAPGGVRLWDPANGRQLAALSGHTDSVRTLAFSPDGVIMATAGSDQTVRLWDLKGLRCIQVLSGHTDAVRYLSFSPDGTHLASAANDKTVKIWDISSCSAESRMPWLEKIAGVAYSPDGQSLATADEHGLITLWNAASSTRVQTIDSDDQELRCLVFSPDGEALATAGRSHKIRLWDPVTAQELLTLEGHEAQVNAVAFSPDGSVLASCSHDGVVRLWRAGSNGAASRP
jgi:WD40 repeat protein